MRTIYYNGQIYTVTNGIKEALVVENGKFIYVGNNEEALSYKDNSSEVVDLEGKFVTAGFNDSHMHVLGYGYSLSMINLAKHTSSLQKLKESIKNGTYDFEAAIEDSASKIVENPEVLLWR